MQQSELHVPFIKVQVVEDNAFVQIELGLEKEDEPNDISQIRPTLQALSSPNMWIGDTGSTKHSTKHRQGGINSQPSTSRTRGIYGQAVKPDAEVDIPGIYCDKNGDEQFAVKLRSVDVIPESHYNLISITQLMEEDHSVKANKKDRITVQKHGRVTKFDIRVETPKGVLWCAYIKRNEPKSEIVAESIDLKNNNQTAESKKGLKSAIKMNIERAHAILGHSNEDTTQKTAVALNKQITRGLLKMCEPCAVAKARQMKVNSKIEGSKAEKFNGRVYHDIAIVKESNDDKKPSCKSVWHVIA